MTPGELAAIKARAAAATPGPWLAGRDASWHDIVSAPTGKDITGNYAHEEGGVCSTPDDAEFIAHAREDVPALVAGLERLRQALEDYGGHSEGCSGQYGPSYRYRCGWRDEARALSVGDGEGAS